MFSITTRSVRATDAKAAATAVTAYRAEGGGSNRTNWPRLERLLAAVFTVITTGTAVDISDLFPMGDKVYHLAHRALSADLIRPYWPQVQVVALKGAEWKGSVVTGESDTAKGRTVVLCPVE